MASRSPVFRGGYVPVLVIRCDDLDMIPGRDARLSRLLVQGTLPRIAGGAAPEGISVFGENSGSIDVAVIHDGVRGGCPTILRVPMSE